MHSESGTVEFYRTRPLDSIGSQEAGGPMKSKKPKPIRKHRASGKRHEVKRKSKKRQRRRSAKRKPIQLLPAVPVSKRDADIRERALRALGRMRRDDASLSQATRLEGIKSETFLRVAGSAVRRTGRGKQWKAVPEDQISALMTVLTGKGPVTAVVRSSRERRLLAQYDTALRMFRAGEDGAEAALKAFEGKTVGGHRLITDPKLLIQLEEAGQLDFDTLYTSFGVES